MMTTAIKGSEWILLLLAQAPDKGLTPLKLQKSLFLVSKFYPSALKNFYHFIPYNYGPFDVDVYHDADNLVDKNYVSKYMAGQTWDKYQITPEGITEAKKIIQNVPIDIQKFLKKLVSWIIPLSFQELVTTIYKHYPEYRRNSVFHDNNK